MSQENLEVIRQVMKAFKEGGPSSEGARAFVDDEIVFEEPPEQPAPRVARGRAATVEMLSKFNEVWEEHDSEVTELRALGHDRVLLLSIEHFRGRDGIEVDQPCGTIFTLSAGKITRMQPFWEQSAALQAAAESS